MATTRKPAAPRTATTKTAPKEPTATLKMIEAIKKEPVKTILMAEDLTKALRADGLLNEMYAVRMRPLFNDFDIVNADFLEGKELTFQKIIGPVENTLEIVKEMK